MLKKNLFYNIAMSSILIAGFWTNVAIGMMDDNKDLEKTGLNVTKTSYVPSENQINLENSGKLLRPQPSWNESRLMVKLELESHTGAKLQVFIPTQFFSETSNEYSGEGIKWESQNYIDFSSKNLLVRNTFLKNKQIIEEKKNPISNEKEYQSARQKIRYYIEKNEYNEAEKEWERIIQSEIKQKNEDLRSAISFYTKIHNSSRVLFLLNKIIKNDPEIGDVRSFLFTLRPYMRQKFEYGDYKESILSACQILEKDSFYSSSEKQMVSDFRKWVEGEIIVFKKLNK